MKPRMLNSSSRIELTHIVLNDKIHNTGSVINLDKARIGGTVLSKEFQENGGRISFKEVIVYDPWGRRVTAIQVPAVPVTYEMSNKSIAVLHPIAVMANYVARVYFEARNGITKWTNLQKAVNSYYAQLCRSIFGKNGAFNRNILGPRIKRSFRGVVIPGRYRCDPLGESYEWVGIPEVICTKLKILEGDLVVIGRDPTIWMGSVEFLRAYPVKHNAIELHPLLLPQLGCDHDGDQIWGFYPDQDWIPQEKIAQFTRQHATWNKNFNDNKEHNRVEWKHFSSDEGARSRTSGLSVSPREICNGGPGLDRVISYCATGKRTRGKVEGGDELRDIAGQLPIAKWREYAEMINMAQVAMKVFMGPVGLLSRRLLVVGHFNPDIRESANFLAERCAQGLLDAKHLTADQARNFKPSHIFRILNLTDKTLETAEDILHAIQQIVPCDERATPVIEYILKDGRGIQTLSQESFPLFEGVTSTADLSQEGYMPPHVLTGVYDSDEGIITYAFREGLGE